MNCPIPIERRFFSRFQIGRANDCWEWEGQKWPFGYGRLDRAGHRVPAHRVSYELHKGPIPEGLLVRHTCDNPACVNPSHLLLGTYADNNNDTIERGRNLAGNARMAAALRAKPTCRKGHLYSVVGVLWRHNGTRLARYCKECARLKSERGNQRVRGRKAA